MRPLSNADIFAAVGASTSAKSSEAEHFCQESGKRMEAELKRQMQIEPHVEVELSEVKLRWT